jgi:hypothetical protein
VTSPRETSDQKQLNKYVMEEINLCECSSEVLCAIVLVKSGLENRDYGRRGSAALTMRPSISKKLELTSPVSGGRSVGIVHSRTKATELVHGT